MKTIGICAHSAEGASLCFLECVHQGEAALGPHAHPEIVLSALPLAPSVPLQEANDLAGVRRFLALGIEKTKAGGADFFIVPDNTAHLALESPGEALALPGLHIAEVVAEAARAKGFKTLGLLGTKYTMDGPVYAKALARRGLKKTVPGPDDHAFVHASIYDELCQGVFRPETVQRTLAVIERLKAKGCEAVILGCTEIPIIVTAKNSALPILDSTRLLAEAAVRVALEQAAMPTWRGGPIG